MNTLKSRNIVKMLLVAAVFMPSCYPVRDLEAILSDAASAGVPLFGHQDDLLYGHDWNANPDDFSLERSDVLATAGAYPFVLGLDLGGIELGSPMNLDDNSFDLMREAVKKHYQRGGIVTLSWHLRNPLTGGDAWDVSNDSTVVSILPGGSGHDEFVGWMDRACDFITSLRDGNGRQIPILWRPFHEHTGDWFWWCASECSPEQYNALWVMLHDYMTKVRKVEGLLWVISPSVYQVKCLNDRYPGDKYVDVVGLDCYSPTDVPVEEAGVAYSGYIRDSFDFLDAFAADHRKILALSETGFEGLPDPMWWTGVLGPAIEDYPISYVLTWRNANDDARRAWHYFCSWPGDKSEKDFWEWTSNGSVRLLK